MKVTIDLPECNASTGFRYKWEKDFQIRVDHSENEIVISANKEGLISLANHLLLLSQENFSEGFHLHLDDTNSLEENSVPLVIQKLR